MFILQTTTAVLISFLAALAYNEIRNRLAKGRSRRRDLETPGSPSIPATHDVKPNTSQSGVESLSASRKNPFDSKLEAHKQLYYKLHNLEHHAEVLPECRELLVSLLSETIHDALQTSEDGILSIEAFSQDSLDDFLKAKDRDVANRWEDYLARRKSGGPREMFSTKEEAKWWLKQAAPVKYVDGAWLGHINKISTPFEYRNITKNAWQVMSEELGDGDLAKNHVHVYRDLIKDIDAGLPPADAADFIHSRHELTEARCWKAALAQMLISLFPHDFLPEALGFNMAYDSLPLHLLKTVKELRELRLNPYYFELHISIDNADSGHAAMAMSAVANYIDVVREKDGEEAAHIAWKRVQSGYVLAEGLQTTPESHSLKQEVEVPFPRTETEASLINIFAAKTFVAHKIHCNSRLRIGRKSLVDWLEPNAFQDQQWQKEFLYDLGECKPWVIKGDSGKSRLVKELSWEGKMFGSFTQTEVEVVKMWIDELGAMTQSPPADASTYLIFTGRSNECTMNKSPHDLDILVDYPVFHPTPPPPHLATTINAGRNITINATPTYHLTKRAIPNLLPIWFTSTTLLESLPSVPVRAADPFGSAIVRVLRAQTGFEVEGLGVAGMDEVRRTDAGQAIGIVELGFAMSVQAGLRKPNTIKDAVAVGNPEAGEFARWMVSLGMRWLAHRDMLVGMAWAFMELHEGVAGMDGEGALLDDNARNVLLEIAAREKRGLEVCWKEIEGDERRGAEFGRGVAVVRDQLARLEGVDVEYEMGSLE
ncbi:hypothetical protein FB567DRAFT_174036 [Paraphoma chrysanthemicola]|uniref:Uncharacterized protein n=1 Tax=Paraphoma chrysanthemicola TaxID=798071 RepID=A0A8K0W2S3_9PLEO|nr:hypothetical protein FB567DRAFT_174036 [Paraphoma chrysanthemicola]